MVPVIIIIIFGENNVLGPVCIDIYQFRRWSGGGAYGLSYIYCLLFLKTEKLHEYDLS